MVHIINNKLTINLFIVLIFAFIQFYSPQFINIPDTVYKFIKYLTILLMALVVLRNKNAHLTIERDYVNNLIILVLIGQVLSVYNAYAYKGQPLGTSFISMLQEIGFVSYLLLYRSNITTDRIERVIKLFTMTYIFCAIINMINGESVFGLSEFDSDRGGMRYRLGGLDWLIIYLFMNVNKFVSYRKARYLYLAGFLFIFVILSLTRQVIAITFVVALLMIFHKAKLYQKFFVAILLLLGYIFVLPKMTIVDNLVSYTHDQFNAKYENIRLVAFEYYTFEYPRNIQQILFGVGVPSFGKSLYGNEIDYTEQNMKVYRSDVGYANFYFDFGIIPLLCLILAIVLAMCRKTKSDVLYAKYYLLANLLLSIASSPFITSAVSISCCLYILSLKSSQLEKVKDLKKVKANE